MCSTGPHGATGRPGANSTTGREKGALLQTLRVCRAVLRTRQASPCRPLRQHTRVRTLRARTREPVRGACRPPQSPRAAPGGTGPAPHPGRSLRPLHPGLRGPLTFGKHPRGSGGRRHPGLAARRRPRRSGAKPRKIARRWAAPCHGAWQGTPASLGRSGGLKPCPRCAAGRLDPASAPGSAHHDTRDSEARPHPEHGAAPAAVARGVQT